jgi:hypothetical protein
MDTDEAQKHFTPEEIRDLPDLYYSACRGVSRVIYYVKDTSADIASPCGRRTSSDGTRPNICNPSSCWGSTWYASDPGSVLHFLDRAYLCRIIAIEARQHGHCSAQLSRSVAHAAASLFGYTADITDGTRSRSVPPRSRADNQRYGQVQSNVDW